MMSGKLPRSWRAARSSLGLWLSLLALAAGVGLAQADKPSLVPEESPAPPSPDELVTLEVDPPHDLDPGERGKLHVKLKLRSGWHVNANPPTLDYLVPTSVEVELANGLQSLPPRYPPGKRHRFAFADEPLSVYEEKAEIEIPIQATLDAVPGSRVVRGTVRFQACNDQLCLPPATKTFEVVVGIEGKGPRKTAEVPPISESVRPNPPGDAQVAPGAGTAAGGSSREGASHLEAETPLGTRPDARSTKGPDPGRAGVPGAATVDPTPAAGDGRNLTGPSSDGGGSSPVASNFAGRLFQEHRLLAFLSIFLLGLGLNLTPCVYPMLSVTIALFGARQEKRLAARLPAAFVYMIGIAMTYSVLGSVAAFTGTLFGSVLQSPIVLVGIAVVLAAMSLSMFGLFELQVPSSVLTRLGGKNVTGLVGVFLSGLMVGLFAAPCVGPPIVALLAVVAQSGNPWFGFATFFVLSLGLGLPYLVLGTYSGLLQRLPRSGTWMVWVKKLFGILLLAVALFYLCLVVKPDWSGWVVPAALIVGGLYLGFLEGSVRRAGRGAWIQRAMGTAGLVAGIWLIAAAPGRGLEWKMFGPEHLESARAANRPVILDFYADWCVPCHELDRSTFTHPEVMRLASRFTTLKVDLTRFESEGSRSLRERYQVGGVPTIVFLTPDGVEIPDTRVVGYVSAPEFAKLTRRALSATGLAAREGP